MIRVATRRDLGAAKALASALDNHADAPWPWKGMWTKFDEQLARDVETGRMLVWEDDGVVNGFVAWVVEDGFAMLSALSVAPETQGRGIGRHLVDAVRVESRKENVPLVAALIWNGSPTYPFYDRIGMKPVATLFSLET